MTILIIRAFQVLNPHQRPLAKSSIKGILRIAEIGLSQIGWCNKPKLQIQNGKFSWSQTLEWSWFESFFNVTRNDISVIFVMAHRCTGGLKKNWTYNRAPNKLVVELGYMYPGGPLIHQQRHRPRCLNTNRFFYQDWYNFLKVWCN